jgi:DNA-binding XRE family transcriptional regulator
MKPSMDALSQLIKSERAIRGWSQGDLAEHSGVSRKTISDIENGSLKRAPHLRTVHKLLWALPTEPPPPGTKSPEEAWEEIKGFVDLLDKTLEGGTTDLVATCSVLGLRIIRVLEENAPAALFVHEDQVDHAIRRAISRGYIEPKVEPDIEGDQGVTT